MKHTVLFSASAVVVIGTGLAPSAFAQRPNAAAATTVTGATGTITQINYGPGGQAQGFLVGTNILLSFRGNICGGAGTLGVVGNSITYSGTAVTATSGFESVRVSSFKNNATSATYTAPTSTSPTTYGPTSGAIKQLNYGPGGSIDGFLFTTGGSTVLVSTGGRTNTTLTSLLTVGAAVSVTGTTAPNMSACSTTAALEVVHASSLTIGSQTIVIAGGGPGGGFGGGRGPGGPGGPGGPR